MNCFVSQTITPYKMGRDGLTQFTQADHDPFNPIPDGTSESDIAHLEANTNPEVASIVHLFCNSDHKRMIRRKSGASLSSVEQTPIPRTARSDEGSQIQMSTAGKSMSFR